MRRVIYVAVPFCVGLLLLIGGSVGVDESPYLSGWMMGLANLAIYIAGDRLGRS